MAKGTSRASATAGKPAQQIDRNQGAVGPKAQSQDGATGSAIEMLKQDHRKVEGLFQQFEQSSDTDQKEKLVEQICAELIVHMRLEEDLFYPACRTAGVESDTMDEAQVEHDGAKTLLNDLLHSSSEAPFWEAKVSVLEEMIKHHVAEEEKPGEGSFAQAKAHGIDDAGLAAHLKNHKEELQRRAAGERPIRAISLQPTNEEDEMPRYSSGPERDERGRFMSEDDDRDYRRSRYEDDDDYRRGEGRHRGHGGWFGDSEGHSEAARSRGSSRYGSRYDYGSRHDDDERYGEGRRHSGRYDDDDDRHYRSSERDRDERGRFMSDDDYGDRRRGGPDHRGWYGDPRGHSEASRRGWEERRGGSSEDDRRYGSRSRHDDDGGHGGWYGDSRGHAEASRRGWQHRR